jgi:hypothetical protein
MRSLMEPALEKRTASEIFPSTVSRAAGGS